jgi:hypothetical protein
MLYREIIAVCSQSRTKHINILRGLNVELLNVQLMIYICICIYTYVYIYIYTCIYIYIDVYIVTTGL